MSMTRGQVDAAVREQAGLFWWGVVSQTAPLRVRRDYAGSVAADMEPASLVAGLVVGDRVWCQSIGTALVVLGKKQ